MYEQVSHSLLNEILNRLKPEIRRRDLRHFYTRLGANFYAIHSLFHLLYGHRDDFREQMVVANFDSRPQNLDLTHLGHRGLFQYGQPRDLASGETPAVFENSIVVPPFRFYWLTDQGYGGAL